MAPPAWPLRWRQVHWRCLKRGYPLRQGREHWSSRLGFSTRLFFRTGDHCSIPSLVATLCLTRARNSSSACRQSQPVARGPARRVKNLSMGNGNNCKSEQKKLLHRCGRQLMGDGLCDRQRQGSSRTLVSVRSHARHTDAPNAIVSFVPEVRTSFVGCGQVHPCCRLRFRKQTTTPSKPKMCPREQAGNKKPQPCCRLYGQKLHVHPCCRLHGQKKTRSFLVVHGGALGEAKI